MRPYSLFVLLFLPACAAPSAFRSPGEYHGGRLLGAGTYLQEVLLEPKGSEPFRFQAIFQRRATGVMITGLSPGGANAFRVKDSLQQRKAADPAIEVFTADFEPQRSRVLAFYRSFRLLLMLDDKPALPSDTVSERYPDRRPKLLTQGGAPDLFIDEFDWEGRAFRLRIISTDFQAKVTLREYTPSN